jgi:hypothetical protein
LHFPRCILLSSTFCYLLKFFLLAPPFHLPFCPLVGPSCRSLWLPLSCCTLPSVLTGLRNCLKQRQKFAQGTRLSPRWLAGASPECTLQYLFCLPVACFCSRPWACLWHQGTQLLGLNANLVTKLCSNWLWLLWYCRHSIFSEIVLLPAPHC